MPLLKGKSKKTVSKNISELHGGKTYAKTEAKSGKKAANKQAVAIALSKARESGAKIPPKKVVKKPKAYHNTPASTALSNLAKKAFSMRGNG